MENDLDYIDKMISNIARTYSYTPTVDIRVFTVCECLHHQIRILRRMLPDEAPVGR